MTERMELMKWKSKMEEKYYTNSRYSEEMDWTRSRYSGYCF